MTSWFRRHDMTYFFCIIPALGRHVDSCDMLNAIDIFG